MAGPTAFDASAIISGVINQDRLPPGLAPFVVATGAGTADATEALQAAIESAYGKLLFVPRGEYILSQNASTGYCLRIMDSVSILMEPGAVLKLATSVPNTVNAIQIGDGTTAVSGVSIEGGVIDGDAVSNGGSYSIAPALVYVSGPVQRVSIRGMVLRNALGSGLVIDGQSSSSRAKHITVEGCTITEVAEGVRFQKCDEFHMRGGSITKIKSQDGFEPHGALQGWSLRDCYIAEPHPSNSAVEVYPQHGDIVGGLIENCTIVSDELRISLSSGTGTGSFEVNGLTVRGNYFKNSNIYAGVSGRCRNVMITGNRMEGPCHVPRGASAPFCGVSAHGAANHYVITGNRISKYQSNGIRVDGNDSIVSENISFNNGQDAGISIVQRLGLKVQGNRILVAGNSFYDDQEVVTQQAGLSYSGAGTRLVGNAAFGMPLAVNNSGVSPSLTVGTGNYGIVDRLTTVVTMAAGGTLKNIDLTVLGLTPSSLLLSRIVIQPLSNMSPATHAWVDRVVPNIRLRLDVGPAAETRFLLVFEAETLRIEQP